MKHPVDRRSKKPRIGAASFTGSIPKFNPPDDGWRFIEQAYERGFNEEDRTEVRDIVNSFLEWHRFEKEAPFADDVIDKIE
jgi:hypothetical protein